MNPYIQKCYNILKEKNFNPYYDSKSTIFFQIIIKDNDNSFYINAFLTYINNNCFSLILQEVNYDISSYDIESVLLEINLQNCISLRNTYYIENNNIKLKTLVFYIQENIFINEIQDIIMQFYENIYDIYLNISDD